MNRGAIRLWRAGLKSLRLVCLCGPCRQLLAEALNARTAYSDSNSDVVLFTGTGSTGAISHLAQVKLNPHCVQFGLVFELKARMEPCNGFVTGERAGMHLLLLHKLKVIEMPC